MRNKKAKVETLQVVEALKSLDCDQARSQVSELDLRAEKMQRQLTVSRELHNHREAGLEALLRNMPTFDPVVFRAGVASVQAASKEARAAQERASDAGRELEQARELLLQVTAAHQIVQKEYRKSVGKLARAKAQKSEFAREDVFSARLRSAHGCIDVTA